MKSLSPLLLLVTASLFLIVEYFFLKLAHILYPDVNIYTGYFWGLMSTTAIVCIYLFFDTNTKSSIIKNFPQYWKAGILLGSLVILMAILWFWGMWHAPIGIISFLDNMTIPISFLLGFLFLKERISFFQLLTLGLAGFGFFLFSNLSHEIPFHAFLAMLGMAIAFSLQSFIVKKYLFNYDFISFTFIRNFFTAVLIIPVFYYMGLISPAPFGAIALFTIGTISGFFLARIFYFEAHKHVSIGAIHFFGLIEPMCIMTLSILFLGESISAKKIIAAGIVILGLFLFFKTEESLTKKKKKT